jgi:selenoprotein W-related protein
VSLTNEVLEQFTTEISNWTLIPSGGGAFEVIINGDLVYSKKDNGRHAEPGEVLGLIQKAL